RAQVGGGSADVAEQAVVWDSALCSGGRGGVIRGGVRRLAPGQVRHDDVVAKLGEAADDLLGAAVIAGHVVDHANAAAWPIAVRSCGVGLDLDAVVTGDSDGL